MHLVQVERSQHRCYVVAETASNFVCSQCMNRFATSVAPVTFFVTLRRNGQLGTGRVSSESHRSESIAQPLQMLIRYAVTEASKVWAFADFTDEDVPLAEVCAIPKWYRLPASPETLSRYRHYLEEFGCSRSTDDSPARLPVLTDDQLTEALEDELGVHLLIRLNGHVAQCLLHSGGLGTALRHASDKFVQRIKASFLFFRHVSAASDENDSHQLRKASTALHRSSRDTIFRSSTMKEKLKTFTRALKIPEFCKLACTGIYSPRYLENQIGVVHKSLEDSVVDGFALEKIG